MTKNFVAIDLGAESGRAMVGKLDGARLELELAHRFPNCPVRVAGHLYWDVPRLFAEIQNGLALAAKQCGGIASVGVDTWGVDFGLLDKNGGLIGNQLAARGGIVGRRSSRIRARARCAAFVRGWTCQTIGW
jgi:sugar (pentulose or hexulose) kinase